MKTFNTYQEAKIENKDSEILKARDDWQGREELIGKFIANKQDKIGGIPYVGEGYFEICNPADYCITVEQFLRDGHKFVDGDLFINHLRELKSVGKIIKGNHYTPDEANSPDKYDDNCFILRAKALEQTETPEEKEAFDVMAQDNEAEIKPSPKYNKDMYRKVLDEACEQFGCIPSYLNRNIANLLKRHKEYAQALSKSNSKLEQPKPKHTKVEYEQAGFHKAHEAMYEHEMVGELYVYGDFGFEVASKSQVANGYIKLLYRKVVTELTEREAFIEAAKEFCSAGEPVDLAFGQMFDSGKFKLVEGK